MVSNAPFTIKGSHKVFVAGPLVKKTGGKDSFRSWLQSEAAKVGEVVEILVDELPADVYLLPLVKSKGFIAVAATVKFSAPGTASKFIAGHHGKFYDKNGLMSDCPTMKKNANRIYNQNVNKPKIIPTPLVLP